MHDIDLEQGFTGPYCIELEDAGQLYTLDVMPTLLEAMWVASAYAETVNESRLLVTDLNCRVVA